MGEITVNDCIDLSRFIADLHANHWTSLAEKVLQGYADIDGFNEHDCERIGLSKIECLAITDVLEDDVVDEYDRVDLEQEGFARKFVDIIAGPDGWRALNIRVKYLTEFGLLLDNIPFRASAAKELGEIGPRAASAIPRLLFALRNSSDFEVRIFAAQAVAKIDVQADGVVYELVEALKWDDDPFVKIQCALSLAKADNLTKYDIRMLSVALRFDEDPRVRTAVVEALGAQRAHAEDAMDYVEGAYHTEKSGMVQEAMLEAAKSLRKHADK